MRPAQAPYETVFPFNTDVRKDECTMSYTTTNEYQTFDFKDAYIAEMRLMNNSFYAYLDNVTILAENSKNRDIRQMRANNFTLKLSDATIDSFIEEGYRIYNADGILAEQKPDRVLPASEYPDALKEMSECTLYSIKKDHSCYLFSIDTDDHTYLLRITASSDKEHWERFLTKE